MNYIYNLVKHYKKTSLHKKNYRLEISLAAASILCTAPGGDHNKYPPPCVGFGSKSLLLFFPETDFAKGVTKQISFRLHTNVISSNKYL